MPETSRERVLVSDDFWRAYDRGELDEAGEVLLKDLTEGSHHAATEACDDSFAYEHVRKYLSEDMSFVEGSIEGKEATWNDAAGGTIEIGFEESRYFGCDDYNRHQRQEMSLSFGVSGTISGKRFLWVEVLREGVAFSHE